MLPDIKINGVSMYSLGWLRESVSFPTPKSQTQTIVVPGRNSPIRFTEALGSVSFEPRSFDMTFTMLGTRLQFNQRVSAVVNRFAGRLCQISTSEEPELYLIGTLQAAPTYDRSWERGSLFCPARTEIPTDTMRWRPL